MSSAAFALPDRALVLDRYRPLKPLGHGGSGSVWLARDERTGLEVALKIVPREGKRAARAAREMEAASRLRHERCVRAYDFGGDAGHVYIAYEYVRGRTLRETLRSEDLDDAEAVEVAAQVLDGLAHAHRNGIIHRDVKPSNVLVEESDEISVRVLDFGLAQFDEADTLTAVGDVPGTLAYISPERLGGEEASERSDVWAVGVILWEALAGSHPFWGVPMPEVASTIASGAPPLSARRGDLPRRLLAAIDGALAVDPAKRPTAARLAEDLREAFVVARRPRPTSRRPPSRKTATKSRARAAEPALSLERRLAPAGLAAVATLVGGSLLPFWPAPVLAVLAVAAGVTTLRAPRIGLALTLATPLFALGNVAQAAAVVYEPWRSPGSRSPGATRERACSSAPGRSSRRSACSRSCRSPCSRRAERGGVRCTPESGSSPPPRSPASRGAHCRSEAAPSAISGSPGASARPTSLHALGTVVGTRPELATTALALAVVAALLPRATARGHWGVAGLGALQLTLVFAWAPSIPWPGFVLGTWLLCGLLAARPFVAAFARERAR